MSHDSAAPAGMRWLKAHCGYQLHDGVNRRAVIVPLTPRKWNDYSRWTVDALGLRQAINVKTLDEATAIAHENA